VKGSPRYSVLFRRGEKAVGMFVVFSGKVSLDFGIDSSLVRTYGAGALVGLPATITGRNRSGNRPNRGAYLLDEYGLEPSRDPTGPAS
jgi:CRP-like cAMP-binding protein